MRTFGAFYKGLFGGDGSVDTRFSGDSHPIGGWETYVNVPNFEFPNFFEWVPKKGWDFLNEVVFATPGYEYEMSVNFANVTIGPVNFREGGYQLPYRTVNETFNLRLPGSGPNTRTRILDNYPYGRAMVVDRFSGLSLNINTDGTLDKGYYKGATFLNVIPNYDIPDVQLTGGSQMILPMICRVRTEIENPSKFKVLRFLGVRVPFARIKSGK